MYVMMLVACAGMDYNQGYVDGCEIGQDYGTQDGEFMLEYCAYPEDGWAWDPKDPSGENKGVYNDYYRGLNDGYSDCYWPAFYQAYEGSCE